jgi:sugar lactone lactonase YvrE
VRALAHEGGLRRRSCAAVAALLFAPPLHTGAASGAGLRAQAAGPVSAGSLLTRFPRRRRARETGISLTPSSTRPYWVCPEGVCDAIVDPGAKKTKGRWGLHSGPLLEGSGEDGGYDPQDLQAAYKIPSGGGSTQTIALVDADGDKTAETDLAKYRERYGLEACTTADGCFRKVNEKGEEANYPADEKGWEGETSVDLDMASAACPHCHILLVEASTASVANLAASVNTAAKLGATEISNSYGIAEEACGSGHCEEVDSDYDHAGVLVVASAGDSGYDDHYEGESSPSFPATSPYVLAVGGTSLHKATGSRGWSESVWNEPKRELGTGSGCSLSETKPSWQTDKGCTKRTDNDVAAVAACETPISVYSTAYKGWEDFCGTSVSAPLVAGILAHAGAHTRSLGAESFYEDRGALFAVTTGSNGTCSTEYLCSAEKQESGYDGPAGLGTPDGLPSPPPVVSGVSPRNGSSAGGSTVTISGSNFEEVTAVRFGASAAKSFTVSSASSISAVAPAGSGTVEVTVETVAGSSATTAAGQFTYVPELQYALEIGPAALGGTPSDVAVSGEGDIWVSEFLSPAVKEFSESGAFLRELPAKLESPCTGSLSESVGVAVDAKGNVWVTDRDNDRVLKFSPEGRCELEFGSPGEGAGQFEDPQGIAVPANGRVWVVDTGNARVQEFSEAGEYLRQFPVGPSTANAWGIAADGVGHVWVAAMTAPGPGVREYNESGRRIGQISSPEAGGGPFEWADSLAVNASDQLFVAYWQPARVEVFGEGSELLTRFGSCCSGEAHFEWPIGLAAGAKGELWVAEMSFGRVEKWTPAP